MKIGVIMGGDSSEREISLLSGREMIRNLDKTQYEIVPITLDKKEELFERVSEIDFALIALHGRFGEDGTIQAALDTLKKPYSGCGVLTSALCMNKNLTKKILKSEGINTSKWLMVKKEEGIKYDLISEMGYPLVVKPNSGGSSIGTFIINNSLELEACLAEAGKYDEEIMIEKYLKGEEYTVCILNGEIFPIMAIKPFNSFFDFTSKYENNGTLEEVAELDEILENKIKDLSKRCWNIFNCQVYARIDIIVMEGEPYILEINTLPGMTIQSIFPKSANAKGMSFSQLLDNIIRYSLMKR